MNWMNVGAFLHEGDACTFTVWAPLAKKVALHIEGVVHHPEKMEYGYYSITLPQIREGCRYQYRLDDGNLIPDPASRWQPEGVHEASAVCSPFFNWSDQNWKGPDATQMVIYEIHTGTFSPAGDFKGIIDKLPWLQLLGVNAIEIMPVNGFPGSRNWGYDVVFPFDVHTAYGGAIALKELVDEAHRFGIAVILDVVYNHLGPEGNYLVEYAPYLTDKYKTPWGPAINFDDAYADGVRHYYWQNALMWLNEFHIDGLRLDAVHAIRDSSADHFLAVLQRKVDALQEQSGIKKILIAESDLNDPRVIQKPSAGGYGLAAQWNDEFHHALHALVTGERKGYYQDFGESWQLIKSLRDSYVFTGQYSECRKRHFGIDVGELPYNKFVVFLQNHDQTGNRAAGERIASLISFELMKVAIAITLLSPHIPFLFMGEEYGEENPFCFFADYGDPALSEATKKGRKEEFKEFHQEEDVPDPGDPETFRKSKLTWNTGTDQAMKLFSFYRHLIAIRKSQAVMKNSERSHLNILPVTEEGMVAFSRSSGNEQLLFFFNFHPSGNKCSFPLSGSHKKIFDSSAQDWNGPGEPVIGPDNTEDCWPVNPQSVVIFEKTI